MSAKRIDCVSHAGDLGDKAGTKAALAAALTAFCRLDLPVISTGVTPHDDAITRLPAD